jgi:cell division protease FtsH
VINVKMEPGHMYDMIECVGDEDDDEDGDESNPREDTALSRLAQARAKRADLAESFLGGGKKIEVPVVVQHYYENLLALALKAYLKSEKWKVVRVLGLHKDSRPDYNEINIGPGKRINVLTRGRLLLSRADSRLSVRIKFTRHGERAWIAVEGPASIKNEVRGFAADIDKIVKKLQLYKGQKIKYNGSLEFLQPGARTWDDLSLLPELKEELMANTVGFLKRSRELARYGIPRKRGLILAGKPGTGKTLISKVLMSNSPGITCLAADPALLVHARYIRELYDIAGDLKPSIVFLEDIDLIGESRSGPGARGDALNELLDILDGVKECSEVVTIATTNYAEALDDALSQRPSRFDRIITMRPPGRELRREIVRNLCRRIPLDQAVQDHVVSMTEGYTPAQVQEVIYGLVIQHKSLYEIRKGYSFTREEVDSVLRRISRRNSEPIGFKKKDIYYK